MSLDPGNERILITGGAGFIGSHLVEACLERGYSVRVLDNFSTGKPANLQGLGDGVYEAGRDFEVVEGDIRDYSMVRGAMSGITAVLHQAALGSVPRSVKDPLTTQLVNADGALNVFLAAKEEGIGRVVYASSSSVYGDNEELPKREGNEGDPLSPYALTKQINESYGRLFHSLYGLNCVGLRYFNVYGPRQDAQSDYAAVIPKFVTALLTHNQPIIYGNGEQSRDFTYVKDVAEANLLALKAAPEASGAAYNVGRGKQWNLLDLLDILKGLLRTEIAPRFDPPRAGDVPHSWADTTLVERELGFRARYDLAEGLGASIDWYRRNLI